MNPNRDILLEISVDSKVSLVRAVTNTRLGASVNVGSLLGAIGTQPKLTHVSRQVHFGHKGGGDGIIDKDKAILLA